MPLKVHKLFSKLKNKIRLGSNSLLIVSRLLKIIYDLVFLTNLTFNSGVFPEEVKMLPIIAFEKMDNSPGCGLLKHVLWVTN